MAGKAMVDGENEEAFETLGEAKQEWMNRETGGQREPMGRIKGMRPMTGMLVARASPAPEMPRRERHRIYVHQY